MIESAQGTDTQPGSRGCRGKCGCAPRSTAPESLPALGALEHGAAPSTALEHIAAPSATLGPVAARTAGSDDVPHRGCGCGNHGVAGPAATDTAESIGTSASAPPDSSDGPSGGVEAAGERRGTCACAGLRPYRRMHSLAGIAFAAFLCVHFLTGASALSPQAFQENANLLQSFSERYPGVELIAVAVPLLALAALGGRLLIEAGLSPARKRCNRGGKTRYFLQRVSALIVLSFIVFHVATLSRWGLHGGLHDPARSYESVAAVLRANAFIAAFYLTAIVAVSYHLANGLWTGAVAWGAIVSDRAKRNWEIACAAFGTALCLAGVAAWYAFVLNRGSA
jgi:succinate dehydrogenase / fumarate reductase cytochrome b subunit